MADIDAILALIPRFLLLAVIVGSPVYAGRLLWRWFRKAATGGASLPGLRR